MNRDALSPKVSNVSPLSMPQLPSEQDTTPCSHVLLSSHRSRKFGMMNVGAMRTRRNRSTNRTGAFTVEFAFCCGIFFMVMMAGIEFTRFMYARHSVDQAAYESARVGIIPGATPEQVETVARRILNATGIRGASVEVTPTTFDAQTATVNVKIKCDYSENSWIGPVFLVGAKIESDLTLDHENKAYLVTERDPDIGDNEDEPIDY